MTDAIVGEALKASRWLASRINAAEAELDQWVAQTSQPTAKLVDIPTKLTSRLEKLVDKREEPLGRDPHRASEALREICGEIAIFPHESGEYLVAKVGLGETSLKAAVGPEKFVVAGGGFGTYLQ